MSGYIGSKASVVSSGAERKKTFAITTTTTELTGLSYTPNFVHVFHNGIRLVDGTDYTATNGTTITLTNAAENGDEVVVVSYGTFTPADAYTKAEADDRYVNVAGDTMTGTLDVSGVVRDTNGLRIGASNAGTGYGLRIGASGATDPLEIWREHSSGDQMQLSVDYYGRVTMPYQPAFQAFSSAAPGTGGSGNLVFGNVHLNVGGCYNASNGFFTAPIAGVYQFNGHTLSRGGGYSFTHFRLNGVGFALGEDSTVSSNFRETSGSVIINLSSGDTVNLYSASNTYGSIYDWFSGFLIG